MHWLSQHFELSRGGSSQNIRPMEGLRGFAVFLVFLVHYLTLVRPWIIDNQILAALCNKVHTIGGAGVDLFFVLSGYLIYGSLISKKQPITIYIKRRILRIYPSFTVVFIIYIALSCIYTNENKIPSSALEGTIYLVQNFLLLPGLFNIEPMITVAWSLSYEMFYYLITPITIAAFGLRERQASTRVLFFAIVSISLVVYCAIFGGPVLLIMFISGILLHEAESHKKIPSPSGSFGFLALITGLLGTLIPIYGTADTSIMACILFVSFFILCLSCFRRPESWLVSTLSWTPLRWLGNMSYSYYLLHGLALKGIFLVLTKLIPESGSYGIWWFWILLPLTFVLTLIPTTILFLVIEKPFSLDRRQAVTNDSSSMNSTTQIAALTE